jgi:iron complex outermembrane receptor protein
MLSGKPGKASTHSRSPLNHFSFNGKCLALFLLGGGYAMGQSGQSGLADATLEELLNTQVTSVSKKEQSLSKTAAAVFVISAEDIRRSGATNLPDVLRAVPGVEVAQINANTWAVTIRGFNSRFSDKVLVLVDGRSVYTPSFSGVYWDQIDVPLEDIERIEVIRGPGATIWGANAVNGVINIITKTARTTEGGLATTTAGNQQQSGMAQYGDEAGGGGAYRAFVKYGRTADSRMPDGSRADDGWSQLHGGFRTDWTLSPKDSLTVQGDIFSNWEGQTRTHWFLPLPGDSTFSQPVDTDGGNLLARWRHEFAGGSDLAVQTYFDYYHRNEFGAPEVQKTVDFDFQYHFKAGRNDVVWGAGYRQIGSSFAATPQVSMTPARQTDRLYNAFFQDEIQLTPALWFTLGSKVEHNVFTGFEFEPSARLAWSATKKQTLWAAASRAIRQPSQLEESVNVNVAQIPLDPYTLLVPRLVGDPHFRSEELRDFELGYRTEPSSKLSIDVTGFLSFYRHLGTLEPQPLLTAAPPLGSPYLLVIQEPYSYDNKGYATTYGGEVALNWKVNSRWRLSPSYSLLHINFYLDPTSQDTWSQALVGNSPEHTIRLHSTVNLTPRLDWDQTVSWSNGFQNGVVPSHTRLDTRVAWRPGESLEFSVTGQNLLRPGFLEFGNAYEISATEAQRSVFAKLTWRF